MNKRSEMCRLPELHKHVKTLFPAGPARHPSPPGNPSIYHYLLLSPSLPSLLSLQSSFLPMKTPSAWMQFEAG